MSNQITFLKEEQTRMEADLNLRDECEAKVNDYVQELVNKNKELQ